MEPYIIRLQRAWQRLEWDDDETLLSNQGMMLPDELPLTDRCTSVTYERRFNRPSNLEPHEQVWLVTELLSKARRVALNEQPLACVPGANEVELTQLLLPHNYLQIYLERADAESLRAAIATLKIVRS